jgi:hypothetical protein
MERILLNFNGCDSIIITTTVFTPDGRDTTRLTATTCNPTEAGVRSHLLTNRGGCDSLVITTTQLLRRDTTRLTRKTCNPNLTGANSRTFTNTVGCDSLVVTTVVFDPFGRDTTRLQAKTCDPMQAGITRRLLTNTLGCDSLVITTTNLIPKDTTRLTRRSCNPLQLGSMEHILPNFNGCDSIIITTTVFTPDGRDTTRLIRETCDPSQTGTVSQLLTNRGGCDSLVLTTTRLNLAPCAFAGNVQTAITSCPDRRDGTASIIMSKGQPPFGYTWSGGGKNGSGEITSLNTPLRLDSLAPGTYRVTITKPNTPLDTVIQFTVGIPVPVSLQVSAVLSGGTFALKCAGDANGVATTNLAGGTPPYRYQWNTGTTTAALGGVPAGTYRLTVTDAKGCSSSAAATLTAPPPLRMRLAVAPPACGDTQADVVATATGGVANYAFTVNNQPRNSNILALPGGRSIVAVTDKNGCRKDTAISITLPPVPTLSLPKDTIIKLGQTLTLTARTNILKWDTLIWRELPDPQCPGCLQQTWRPAHDQKYQVILLDTLGCRASADIVVYVRRDIDIYVPNVIAPDTKGNNNVFRISVSKYLEDAELSELFIFDRWGNMAYRWDEPVPIGQWPGWDGRFGGQAEVNPAVFVYYMKIKLPTGEVIEKKGDVTVIR